MEGMRYKALAVDFDDTLAMRAHVSRQALAALHRVKDSGRRLVLVTGRQVGDLLQVFPAGSVFDRVVAENGAVLYTPETRARQVLASPPPAAFTKRLAEKGVSPLSIGQVVVATTRTQAAAVQRTIEQMGLELQLVNNEQALMVLPPSVDKASGLSKGLRQLGITAKQTVGIGNAENDIPLLASCGLGIAVANAVPELKRMAAHVLKAEDGEGVIFVANALVEDDLSTLSRQAAAERG